jgi:hypothetical protein
MAFRSSQKVIAEVVYEIRKVGTSYENCTANTLGFPLRKSR